MSDENATPAPQWFRAEHSQVALVDLGSALIEAVTAAANGTLASRAVQERINNLTDIYGLPVLLGMIQYAPKPSEFPTDASSTDFGVEHVAQIIATLGGPLLDDQEAARVEILQLCLGLFGWTLPEVAGAVVNHTDRPDAALPIASQAAAVTHWIPSQGPDADALGSTQRALEELFGRKDTP